MHLGKLKAFGLLLLLVFVQVGWSNASILDYLWTRAEISPSNTFSASPNVPFEVNDVQNNFIGDVAKILGNKLSDLDFCQQRVVLQLKNSCKSLSDEELSRLAVALLNCQLINEQRPSIECSDTMNLKECTEKMSPEVWNNYNLLLGRAKSVCLLIRQDQFRGLTEITINRLMESVNQHLQMMEELKKTQQQLEESTLNSIDDIAQSSLKLMGKQQELLHLAESQRIIAAANFREFVREKIFIKNGQVELLSFLTSLKVKINEGLSSIQDQNDHSREIFKELVKDLTNLQETTMKISNHLDDANSLMMSQNKRTNEQLEETIIQLSEANKIVSEFSQKIASTQRDFLSNIEWLRNHLGNDEKFWKRLVAVLIHLAYLLVGMICLVFVNADSISRFMFLSAISLNMAATLYEFIEMDLSLLTEVITALLTANFLGKMSKKIEWRKYFTVSIASHSSNNAPEQNNPILLEDRSGYINNNINRPQTRVLYNGNTRRNADVISNDYGLYRNGNIRSEPNIRNRSTTVERERSSTMNIFCEIQDEDEDDYQVSNRSRSSTPFTNSRKRCKGITNIGTVCRNMTITPSEDYCRLHERQSAAVTN